MIEIKKSIEQGFAGGGLYDILTQLQNQMLLTPTKVYYVYKGGNGQGGESWETAYPTLTEAITEQRRMRALLPSAEQSVATWIIMAPGDYDENIISFPFSCNIVGLGNLGTDKATRIYPAIGSPLAGTVSGLGLYNLRFQVKTTAVDCLDFNILHNTIIDGCEMVTDTGDAVNALSTQTCQNTIIRNCRVYDQDIQLFTNGFYFGGGVDCYFAGSRVENNRISGLDPTGTGIYVDLSAAGSTGDSQIENNIIVLTGAGIGIDENSDRVLVIGNTVFHQAGTGYDCNADLSFDNRDNNGTTRVYYPTQTINT